MEWRKRERHKDVATRLTVILAYCVVLFCPQTSKLAESLDRAAPSQHQGSTIKGQVTDIHGLPMNGVEVSLQNLRNPEYRLMTFTRDDGSYRFNNLRQGIYELTFLPGTAAEQRRTVELIDNAVYENQPLTGLVEVVNVQLGPIELPSPVPTPTLIAPSPRPTPIRRPTPNYNADSNRNSNGNNTNTSINVNARAQGASLDDQLRNLLQGKITYKIPQVMKLGQDQTIRINIAKELTSELQQAAAASGSTIADLKIGDTMDVNLEQLESGAFDIRRQHPTGSGPAWQAIAGDQPSEWIFNVKALQAGTHTLRLIATVQLKNSNDQATPHSFTVYEDATRVSTSYWYYAREFARNHWQLLLTAILIPVVPPLALRIWKLIKRPPSGPSWENEP